MLLSGTMAMTISNMAHGSDTGRDSEVGAEDSTPDSGADSASSSEDMSSPKMASEAFESETASDGEVGA